MQSIRKREKIKEEEMAVIKLNRENFTEKTKQGTILVDFWATWCGPCSMIAPILEQVAEEENFTIGKVNIDEERELAMEFAIEAIPTLVLLKDGQEQDRSIGLVDKNQIKELLQK